MNRAFLAALTLLFTVAAYAQAPTRIRANVVSFDGAGALVVKTAVGREVKVNVNDKTRISFPKPLRLADIKEGDFIGSAAMAGPDGKLVAREVRVFSEAQRGTGEGHRDWDLPGSTMTNATVSRRVSITKGGELTVKYPGGEKVIVVPEGTPVSTGVPGDKSLLVPGSYVVLSGQTNADGSVTAVTINATGKDGTRPAN
jgi:hypothetical protein